MRSQGSFGAARLDLVPQLTAISNFSPQFPLSTRPTLALLHAQSALRFETSDGYDINNSLESASPSCYRNLPGGYQYIQQRPADWEDRRANTYLQCIIRRSLTRIDCNAFITFNYGAPNDDNIPQVFWLRLCMTEFGLSCDKLSSGRHYVAYVNSIVEGKRGQILNMAWDFLR